MYFNKFTNNQIPDEKISFDLISQINPLLSVLPYAAENNDVIPSPNNLLSPIFLKIPYNEKVINKDTSCVSDVPNDDILYTSLVIDFLQNVSISKYMLAKIFEHSNEYEHICVALYKLLERFKQENLNKGFAYYNVVRKIYDLYFQLMYTQ